MGVHILETKAIVSVTIHLLGVSSSFPWTALLLVKELPSCFYSQKCQGFNDYFIGYSSDRYHTILLIDKYYAFMIVRVSYARWSFNYEHLQYNYRWENMV